ncbi:MAG: DUF2510 domain-containing protein [Nocardioidaceae bacterium]
MSEQPAPPQQHPPGWYPDPWGQHEHRWFDGAHWTEHVGSHGRQSVSVPRGGRLCRRRRPDRATPSRGRAPPTR